jgi:Nucleotidyltransferase domain
MVKRTNAHREIYLSFNALNLQEIKPMADIQLAPTPERTAAGLITAAAIDALARQIAAQFDPERIYLFGSYAYGTPTPDSDVDIMVVMEAADIDEQRKQIGQQLPMGYSLGLILYTPTCFENGWGWVMSCYKMYMSAVRCCTIAIAPLLHRRWPNHCQTQR